MSTGLDLLPTPGAPRLVRLAEDVVVAAARLGVVSAADGARGRHRWARHFDCRGDHRALDDDDDRTRCVLGQHPVGHRGSPVPDIRGSQNRGDRDVCRHRPRLRPLVASTAAGTRPSSSSGLFSRWAANRSHVSDAMRQPHQAGLLPCSEQTRKKRKLRCVN